MAYNNYPGVAPTSEYMSDNLLENVTGLGVQANTQVANVTHSGQLGTGIRITKLDGATPLVFNPVIPVVLTVPTMWNLFPEKQEMLRALMETHAKQITGIDFSYSLETTDTNVGHDGQTLKTPTTSKRSGVNPSATFVEYTCNIVYNFFRDWIFDIQHPDSMSSILPAMGLTGNDMPGWTLNAYSMSMLFIQYDPTGLPDRIVDAFVIVGMFPTEIGEEGFQRVIGSAETKERNINFTGVVQHNNNTRELGVNVAKLIALHRINYNYALPGVKGTTDAVTAMSDRLTTSVTNSGIHWEANAGGVLASGNNSYTPAGTNGSGNSYVAQNSNEAARNSALAANPASATVTNNYNNNASTNA